jgi:hypothetical protein
MENENKPAKMYTKEQVRELTHKAFYEGREISRRTEDGIVIFKHPTYEGWLRTTQPFEE